MRRISFAQRFIAYLCCFLLNVPVLAQAHTIGPNGPIPMERAPLPLPAPGSLPESRPVPPPVTKPVNTPMPAPENPPAESETAGRRKKEIYYIHTDHLNTPRAITNGEQKKVWKWGNVDPFGKNAADENPEGRGRFALNLRFPGQYYDRETGLHYNWHRDYDPGLGRYVQSDPIGLSGGLMTYAYVSNTPLMRFDSNGMISWPSLPDWMNNASSGVLSYYIGLARAMTHLARRSGSFGVCEQQRAIEEEAIVAAALNSLKNPDVRDKAIEWLANHQSYVAGRFFGGLATGFLAGLALGIPALGIGVFGLKIMSIGIGLTFSGSLVSIAAFGDMLEAARTGADDPNSILGAGITGIVIPSGVDRRTRCACPQ